MLHSIVMVLFCCRHEYAGQVPKIITADAISSQLSLPSLQVVADALDSLEMELVEEDMKIYIVRKQRQSDDAPTDVGIVIEGIIALRRACCYLLGLTYALDLRYP